MINSSFNYWKFQKPSKNVPDANEPKQRFYITVSINLYEVDQKTELFVPKSPKILMNAKRNALYPILVYDQGV